MGVRKSDHGVVAVVITGAPVPILRDAGRAQLHHSERHAGPYKDMAMSSGSYLGIDIGSIVGLFRFSGRACSQNQY